MEATILEIDLISSASSAAFSDILRGRVLCLGQLSKFRGPPQLDESS
jgi:hypothetical protein